MVTVRATALSQLVRSIAAGKHYSGTGQLPVIPGVDGVGTLDDGSRVYVAFPRAPYGTMAERTVVPVANCVAVPDGVTNVAAAAIANPGMSSWAALVERAHFRPGESVLVNGATGTSGRLAVQVAKYLGAKRVIATGRNRAVLDSLRDLGADDLVELEQPPEALTAAFTSQLAGGVDVVLDYLWGPPAERLLAAFGGHGGGAAEPRVRYVQIGSMAGQTIAMPAAVLRSSGLELMGSGLGSVSNAGLLRSIASVFAALAAGKVSIEFDAVPLADVEKTWAAKSADRVVFTV
jgi:NADPH:quinone reductase-like Zn-dependent oxidoreductase